MTLVPSFQLKFIASQHEAVLEVEQNNLKEINHRASSVSHWRRRGQLMVIEQRSGVQKYTFFLLSGGWSNRAEWIISDFLGNWIFFSFKIRQRIVLRDFLRKYFEGKLIPIGIRVQDLLLGFFDIFGEIFMFWRHKSSLKVLKKSSKILEKFKRRIVLFRLK